jgi:hypothetical protein
VQGKDSFFTLWSDEKKKNKSIADGSYSFELNSWSAWDEELCINRVIPSRHPTGYSNVAVSAAKRNSGEETEAKVDITADDINKAKVHPEDEVIYKDYTRCRWDFSEKEISASGVVKMKGWIPYYKLDERKKEIVLRKKASSAKLAIWAKWPKASVEISKKAIC